MRIIRITDITASTVLIGFIIPDSGSNIILHFIPKSIDNQTFNILYCLVFPTQITLLAFHF